jgi:D-aminopeptidase
MKAFISIDMEGIRGIVRDYEEAFRTFYAMVTIAGGD